MAQLSANGIQIEYDTFGEERDRPLLLIMGLGAQMTRWPELFCQGLAEQGHYVIRFDNRDVGLSERFEAAGPPDIAAITAAVMAGRDPEVPYTLDDMANDSAGLLDALALDAAHVCGASLGGMIAQTMAIQHPDRVLSLTSIMSSTGNRNLPPPKPEAMAALMSAPAQDREGSIARTESIAKIIGSPAYPANLAELRDRAAADFDRSFYPVGVARQMAAASVQADRRAALAKVQVPALVIHGNEDPLVPVTGGIDTHEALVRSTLWAVDGMGHDLPKPLWPSIIERIGALTSSG
ncbi:MAG: alpha/beta fold hydrolase [Pseudomonadales bacterium]